MWQKIRVVLKNLFTKNTYDEHQKRMKEMEEQYERNMQELLEILNEMDRLETKVFTILSDKTIKKG